MCTGIVETTELSGSGRGVQGWFPLTHANVGFDHPSHVALEYAVLIDFVNPAHGPGARVAVELTAESARGLARAILTALEAGEEQSVLARSR